MIETTKEKTLYVFGFVKFMDLQCGQLAVWQLQKHHWLECLLKLYDKVSKKIKTC